jgi:hypothetical protein
MNRSRLIAILFLAALSLRAAGDQALAQQPASQSSDGRANARSSDEIQLSKLLAQAGPKRRSSFSLMPEIANANLQGPMFSITPAAALTPVTGSGTLGRLTKWSGSNSLIGDSTVYEDKFGKVGVGTDSPTSKLTVAGMIETRGTDGGVKFPDGTVQTTSASGALIGVAHDQTLKGNGTAAQPMGVASPLMVRDLDNPARQPFHFTQELRLQDVPFTVPAGKLLVIEFVSGSVHVPDFAHFRDRKSFPIVFTNSSEPESTIYWVVGDIIEVHPGSFSYGISQTVRIYGSPGTVVDLLPLRTSISYGLLTISGYFVDVGGEATPNRH